MTKLENLKDPTLCPCGDIILADTEDWPIPMCHKCWTFFESQEEKFEKAKEALSFYADIKPYFNPRHGDIRRKAREALKEIEG